MAKLLYLDCFSGVSGDMLLGALLDAGLPLEALRSALGSLTVGRCDIGSEKIARAGVAATRFRVYEHGRAAAEHSHEALGHSTPSPRAHEPPFHHLSPDAHTGPEDAHPHEHQREPISLVATAIDHHASDTRPTPGVDGQAHRSLREIFALIDQSALSPRARGRARELFLRLAEAEAAIHQMPVDRVHLHEVGALDSIIDIVGGVYGLEWLGADRIACSPLNVGGGMVRSAHGVFPVPAPATLRLLGDAPVYSSGIQAELVTPTGALFVTSYATEFGPVPAMRIEQVGYGAGERDPAGTPNVLRILVGEPAEQSGVERVVMIECEIDDMNPQIFGVLMDRLHAAGALEVFFSGVQMKKNRPGTLVTIIAPPGKRDALSSLVFAETTTIGLRFHDVLRERLDRESIVVTTPVGAIRVKIARRAGRVINAAPEFDDCARLAAERGLPVKDVQALASKAYLDLPHDQS